MTSFIHDVLIHIHNKDADYSELTFILPSKRARTFVMNELSGIVPNTIFSPEILSIEEFVEDLSQLKPISNAELLFELYQVYTSNKSTTAHDTFDAFLKWGQTLLQDFNEIDRYLIDAPSLFDYLNAIKDLDHWTLSTSHTPLMTNYLVFWKTLNNYYAELSSKLLEAGMGYQGLMYKEAVENLENYIQSNPGKKHVFVGFNALNQAESRIIQELLQNDLAEIYWDMDRSFFENKKHNAGLFLRDFKSKWPYFKSNAFHWLHDHYAAEKMIKIIGTPKHIGQAKYIGELISDLSEQGVSLQKTAIILGDENLLIPVLSSLPEDLEAFNITMGLPLKSIPLASIFVSLFKLHKNPKSSIYYKGVIEILSHPFITILYENENGNLADQIIEKIKTQNMIFLSANKICELGKERSEISRLLFENWNNDPIKALKNVTALIFKIKHLLDKNKSVNKLSLEYLYRFHQLFNMLSDLSTKHKEVESIGVLLSLYKELLNNETLDFQGEPLRGLQIMGMLESRVLDFETVIMASVNEGILPSGKQNNSFIPFDVKRENNLPTYTEKDAVYAYHFFRLLHRAKQVYLIYNSESDALSTGEKSRFITQMEIDDTHKMEYISVSPNVPSHHYDAFEIKKTPSIIEKIKSLMTSGISPSSLLKYIRNPMDYYSQYILDIRETDNVEEVVAANTLGTVIHETLREIYEPLSNTFLEPAYLTEAESRIESLITKYFKEFYKEGDLKKGKNLIIYEIAKRYIHNFLISERKALQAGNTIRIMAIEKEVSATFLIDELPFPIKLKGHIDRIDEYNDEIRIIDYKTGKVMSKDLELVDWEDLTTDYEKYGKSFQVLMYAYILNLNSTYQKPFEAGVISFKNLSAGFMPFTKKNKRGGGALKETFITQDIMNAFHLQLKNLMIEIYDVNTNFIEMKL